MANTLPRTGFAKLTFWGGGHDRIPVKSLLKCFYVRL